MNNSNSEIMMVLLSIINFICEMTAPEIVCTKKTFIRRKTYSLEITDTDIVDSEICPYIFENSEKMKVIMKNCFQQYILHM